MIVDHFFIHDRCFAALRSPHASGQPESRIVHRDANALERLLLGSDSEASALARALLELGVGGGREDMPLLLVMAIHAFHRGGIEAQLTLITQVGEANYLAQQIKES